MRRHGEADVAGTAAEIQHTGLGLIVYESGQGLQVGTLRVHGAVQVGRGARPELAAYQGLVRPTLRHRSLRC